MINIKEYLEKNLYKEGLKYFGIKNKTRSSDLANRWHNDINSIDTTRWKEIENFSDHKGKILDMACGVGTFLFHGLRKGYDVYGIEPEKYKLKYMQMKIDELNYPQEWKDKIIDGVGECLPFEDETFDYITTYQTLEHVQNIEKCIDELIRVLKVKGKIKIQAPDYNSFYEPHYKLPFLPKMNRKLAYIYLKILRKPIDGLNTLNWTTTEIILNYLSKYDHLEIIDLYDIYKKRKINYIKSKYKLPYFISKIIVNMVYYRKIYCFKEEKQINIIIKKLELKK